MQSGTKTVNLFLLAFILLSLKNKSRLKIFQKATQNFENQIAQFFFGNFCHFWQLSAILGIFRQFLALIFHVLVTFRQCNRTLIPLTQSKVPNYRTWVNIALALKRNAKKKLVYIGRARKKVHLVPLFIIGACSKYIFKDIKFLVHVVCFAEMV